MGGTKGVSVWVRKHKLAVALLVVIGVTGGIFGYTSLSLYIVDGGGGIDYDPSTELDDIGKPILDDIDRLLFRITLEWQFTSPYTVDTYYILERIDGGDWFLCDVSNVKIFQFQVFQSGFYEFKVLARVVYEGKYYNSEHSTIKSFEILTTEITPVLKPIIPNPNIDGVIDLDWNQIVGVNGYKVYKFIDNVWCEIADIGSGTSDYRDTVYENGVYKYYVVSYRLQIILHPSNIESVIVEIYEIPPEISDILPSNPSIEINGGASITNSLTVKLTLSCDNAEQMQFQIAEGIWTSWTDYSTTYTITLRENDPDYPDFRVLVVFSNENGTHYDAGYGDIYDDITYEEPPIIPEENGKPTDYTWLYILLGILFGLIGIGIFLKYRKRIIKSN